MKNKDKNRTAILENKKAGMKNKESENAVPKQKETGKAKKGIEQKDALSEEQERAILKDIADQVSYRNIMIKHKYLSSTSQISRIKRKYKDELPRSRKKVPISKETAKKIRTTALMSATIDRADFIIEGIVNAQKVISSSVMKLAESHEVLTKYAEEIPPMLYSIISQLKPLREDQLSPKEKAQLFYNINNAMSRIGNLQANEKVKADVLGKLGYFLEIQNKQKLELLYLKEVQAMMNDFFEAFNLLPEEYYNLLKDEIIRRQPATRSYFTRWEETEYYDVPTEPGDAE